MLVCLSCENTHVSLICDWFERRRPLDAAPLRDLGRQYASARSGKDLAKLLGIGRGLYDWLNGEGWLGQLQPRGVQPLVFEVRAPVQPAAPDWAVLHAPWELLADERGFFAADAELRYAPARRLGAPRLAPDLDEYRLGVAFMAAAPRGGEALDFEAEEAAIMAAARRDLDLFVEESGDPDELGRRLARLRPPPTVLHLSCHGHNGWCGVDGKDKPQPVLMLEDETGAQKPTPTGKLLDALGAYRPRLLFLSACLTAAAAEPAAGGEALSDSMASRLVRELPAVVGWDGSVADTAATLFARELYDDLARSVPLPLAAACARLALLGYEEEAGGVQAESDVVRRDWHMARVWLGPEGVGPIAEGAFERSLIPPDAGAKALLAARMGERLEVADPTMFVGRRRELREALRFLAGRDKAGVLLHGMGRLGKSSLAGRIIDRRSDFIHAVVFGAYDALSLIDVLAKALEGHEPARRLLAERRPVVRQDVEALRPLVVDLLQGPCRGDGRNPPLLLLVDDLERILEPDPRGGRHLVRAAELPVMSALLHAFSPQRSNSRLLLTSRFPFSLVEGGRELAGSLAEIKLSEFSQTARQKLELRQIKAAQAPRDDQSLSDAELAERLPLLARVQAVARGNPGLQDFLGAKFVLCPAVPVATAAAVLQGMEEYLQGGAMPQSEAAREFLQNLAVDGLLALAGDSNRALLRATIVFPTPVPAKVLVAFADLGGEVKRLTDLGLLVPSEDLVTPGVVALAANGLAAGRLPALGDEERAGLAKLAVPALFAAWGGTEGRLQRPYGADLVLTELALVASDGLVLEACAAGAVLGLDRRGQPGNAGTLGDRAVAKLEECGKSPPLDLLAQTANAWQTAGEGSAAEAALAKGAAALSVPEDPAELQRLSNFLFAQGNRQHRSGDLDGSLSTFLRLSELETKRGNEHQLAVAQGRIADILQARGDLDEAMRIRTEEQLPVYKRLGDVRAVAVTQGHIADILQAHGDLDEAMRIRTEEQLPVFKRLGDVREVAIAQGNIADILQARGDLDEAMRIRTEEQLPVFKRLGVVRSVAITLGKIADILQARGDLDEAMRIRTEEQLPVFKRVGDVREVAVTQGRIADIVEARGDLDEAMRIRTEEELPVYKRLGDVRAVAITQGKIADSLQARGDPDTALAMHEARLATNRQLQDASGIAASLWAVANIELEREQVEQAIPCVIEAWSIFDRLDQADGIAAVGTVMGQILAAGGRREEALAVLGRCAGARRKLGRIADAEAVEGMMRAVEASSGAA